MERAAARRGDPRDQTGQADDPHVGCRDRTDR